MSQAILLLLMTLILGRAAIKVGRGETVDCLVSAITTLIYASCLWIPACLQAAHLITSKIEIADLLARPTSEQISALAWRWSLELVVVVTAELFVMSILGRAAYRNTRSVPESQVVRPRKPLLESRRVVEVLLVVGVLANIVFSEPAIVDRANGGQGFSVIMRSFLVVGLSLLAYRNFFDRKLWWLVGAVGVAFLIAGSIRSPLLVVMFGYVAGLIDRGALTPKRFVQLALLAAVVGIFGAIMSNVRGAIVNHAGLPVGALALSTIENPYVAIYESGIDTLDGYRLSMRIAPQEPARPSSILTIFTTFVPRALWPNKPTELSVEISKKYLHYGQGGQFLSPVGYMTIAFGTYGFALIGLFIFAALASWLSRRYERSYLLAIIICIVVRFMMGGAPFDIYYGLTLMLPWIAATFTTRIFKKSRNRRISIASGANRFYARYGLASVRRSPSLSQPRQSAPAKPVPRY